MSTTSDPMTTERTETTPKPCPKCGEELYLCGAQFSHPGNGCMFDQNRLLPENVAAWNEFTNTYALGEAVEALFAFARGHEPCREMTEILMAHRMWSTSELAWRTPAEIMAAIDAAKGE